MTKSYPSARAGLRAGVALATAYCCSLPVPAGAAHAQPPPAVIARSGADAVRPMHIIPFELEGNRIYVQVSGPGFGPSWFLLDSGAQRTHYTEELIDKARLPASGRVGITGAGPGRVSGRRVAAATLRIGSLVLPVASGISGPAEPLFGNIYSSTGRRFEGVLGYDLFAAFVVEIDYEQRLLRLHDRAHFRPPATSRIPLRIVDRKPYFTAGIGLAGSAPTPANVHLDTGAGSVLSLRGRYVAEQRLIERIGPTLRSVIQGVGGATESRLGRIERLQLGRFTFAAPVVTIALAQGAGVRSDSAGLVGGEALRRFTVTIDYAGRSLWLEPNGNLGQPFEADMSGLTITRTPASTFSIVSVAPDTAAAAAGVLPGDQVLGIDGRSAASLTLDQLRALLRHHGATRSLRLRRGTDEFEVQLRLARRI